MVLFGRIWNSSLGLKYIMALTGVALFGFLLTHLAGNLTVFLGPDALNQYAKNLHATMGPFIWVARGGLLGIFALHILSAMRLTVKNRQARPQNYACNSTVQASFASRTMVYSGMLTTLYVLYHLSHFTLNYIGADYGSQVDAQGRHDVYHMVVTGFQDPLTSGLYIAAQLVLGLHLSHGLASLFQSLGINHPLYTGNIRKAAPLIGWGIALAFASMPIAVLMGCVKLAGGM